MNILEAKNITKRYEGHTALQNVSVMNIVLPLGYEEKDLILAEESLQSPVTDAAYLVNATVIGFKGTDLNGFQLELAKAKNFRRT